MDNISMDKKLKFLAGMIVSESNMSKKGKLKMLDFIQKEATITQVKGILLDGKIVEINKTTEKDINERFNNNTHYKTLTEGTLKSLFGMFLISPAGWLAWRLLGSTFSKARRKCGTITIGKHRDICLLRARQTKLEKQINIIKANLPNCKQAKKPDKCQAAGNKKIIKFQSDLKEIKARIDDMKGSIMGSVSSRIKHGAVAQRSDVD